VHVLQLMLTQREVWTSVAPSSALSDRVPGGVHRMRMDPAAPSRSYLKMEEALLRSGLPVTDGERVLDLGAAPGGWSHAFLKRGCHVIGVDRGPMKLRVPDVTSARFTHVREDGLVYVPPAEWLPLDWLVSDMLVPPGKALGLLRRWIGRRWARRFVVTLKLPQKQAWPVLRDVMAWLDRCEGFQYEIRQLYHNRREVTLWGTLGS
jgi:23S rRNA (cytidine2498-2'-O)-methyltransferase